MLDLEELKKGNPRFSFKFYTRESIEKMPGSLSLNDVTMSKADILDLMVIDCAHYYIDLMTDLRKEIPRLDEHLKILRDRIDTDTSPNKENTKCCLKTIYKLLEFEESSVFLKPAKR
jgi:hypothetical protein